MRGCLSKLLVIIAIAYAWYAVLSHFISTATPISFRTAAITLAWMLGLAIFFKIIAPRKRKTTGGPDFTVTVEGVNFKSDDISASARQLEYIKSLGGKPRKNMTMSEASAMIDELKIIREVERQKEVKRRLAESAK